MINLNPKISLARLFLLCLIVFVSNPEASGQNNTITIKLPEKVPVSPTAAAVAQYANYPVDYSVGLVNISVPIYEIKVGDLVLPISLSYHASGLKPRERSGPVGTGWTLNAEPSISRNVNGLPDDKPGVGYLSNSENPNLNRSNPNYHGQLANGSLDGQPDAFYYKLLSERGELYVNRRYIDYSTNAYHGFVSRPFTGTMADAGSTLAHFNMKDRNGIQYLFGGEGYHETTGDNQIKTRWLCQWVKGATTSAMVNFSYHDVRIADLHALRYKDIVMVEDNITPVRVTTNTTFEDSRSYKVEGDGTLTPEYFGGSVFVQITSPQDFIKEKSIKEISFESGKVVFEMKTSEPGTLNKIYVYDKNQTLIREFTFFINKYHNVTTLTKLDSIQISAPGTKIQSYKFDYNSPGRVPAASTEGIDHWGYYNGQDNLRSRLASRTPWMVPSATVSANTTPVNTVVTFNIGGGSREPSGDSEVGTLKTIVSPEGSVTNFSYEPHIYGWDVHPTNPAKTRLSGGLRISRIDVRDHRYSQKNYTRAFEYGETLYPEGPSTPVYANWGVPKRKVSVNDYAYTKLRVNPDDVDNPQFHSRLRIYGSYPLRPITFNNGSSMLYGIVTEKFMQHDGTRAQVIRRKYKVPEGFATEPSEPEISTVPFMIDMKDDMQYGQLLSEEKFIDDSTFEYGRAVYKPLSKTEYEWSRYKTYTGAYTGNCDELSISNYTCRDVIAHFGHAYNTIELRTINPNNYTGTQYQRLAYVEWAIENACMRVNKETQTSYTGERELKIVKEYFYNDSSKHMLPVKIKTSTSDGDLKEELFLYPEDYVLRAHVTGIPEDAGQNYLLGDNRLEPLLEHTVKKSGSVQTTKAIYDGERIQQIKTIGSNGQPEARTNYHTYDAYGNIAEVSHEKGSRTCYLMGYNNQLVVAKIENALYSEIVTLLGQTFIDALRQKTEPSSSDMSQLNGLRSQLGNSMVTTYSYKPLGGVTSITDPKGLISYFDYDGLGRLTRIYKKEQNGLGAWVEKTVKVYQYHLRDDH
ncbi:hypothetical protein ACFSJU_07760 [Paradesertivirga mongoliensis]|uniref:YD repeat-containing protein n=1 Tax=Paradesertivirga mongoliensis TaxID=2100740 RepID=A0ABW4ZJP1_9SPHI|nr:hypothetical protein [Pedobacter mongoliensis]